MSTLSSKNVSSALSRASWGLLASGAAALACSGSDNANTMQMQTTTSESASQSVLPATAAVCQLPSGGYTEACNSCLADNCCAQVEECKNDGACGAQLTCIVDCQADENPTECSMACTASNDVHPGYVAYDDCSFAECLSTCWM